MKVAKIFGGLFYSFLKAKPLIFNHTSMRLLAAVIIAHLLIKLTGI